MQNVYLYVLKLPGLADLAKGLLSMNKKYNIYIYIGIITYIIYHLCTLIYAPIVWFDEVAQAGMARSFLQNHTYAETSRNITWAVAQIDKAYGPVYFFLQGQIVKTFGFTMFNFRFTGLFFGFVDLYLVYRICKQLELKDTSILLIMLLICLDPSFNQLLHAGRMDTLSLFFFLCAYMLFMRIDYQHKSRLILFSIFIGVLLGTTMLTNPRILFSFSFFFFYFLYELFSKKYGSFGNLLIKYGLIAIFLAAVYYLRIYVEFGSIKNFIYENYTNSPIIQEHIGFTLKGVKINHIIFIFAYCIFCFLWLLKNKGVQSHIKLVLFTVPAVFSFMVLVSNGISGRYYGLIAAFTMMLIVGTTVNVYRNVFFKIVPYALLTLFSIVFIFKALVILSDLDQRDADYFEQKITAVVPKNSSVAGDFQYYYMAIHNNYNYQFIVENGDMQQRIDYFTTHRYDYVIVNKANPELDQLKRGFLDSNYKLIATIERPNNNAQFFHKIISKLPYRITEGYSCYIYQHI